MGPSALRFPGRRDVAGRGGSRDRHGRRGPPPCFFRKGQLRPAVLRVGADHPAFEALWPEKRKEWGGAVRASTRGARGLRPRPRRPGQPRLSPGRTRAPLRCPGALRGPRGAAAVLEGAKVVFLPKNGTMSAFTKQGKDLHSRRSSHHMVQGRLRVMLHRRWSWCRFRFA